MPTRAPILDRMVALSDPMRCRLLRLLERHELTVSELCAILQLPQSTVSRHLRTLADEAWVQSRRDGTSRFYVMNGDDLPPDAAGLWDLVRGQVAESPGARQDDARLDEVMARRRIRSREFFSSAADEWDRVRAGLFGERLHLNALIGLLDERWVVGDLGCGTGVVAQAIAPFVARVICVDDSAEMLGAARRRLGRSAGVDVRSGQLESLPLGDGELDLALMILVLHHQPEPGRALAEASRVLRPGGRLLLVDMRPHDRAALQQQMGHVWLGFSDRQMLRYLGGAGLARCRVLPLPPEPEARGPALFVATAHRPDVREPVTSSTRDPSPRGVEGMEIEEGSTS